MLYVNFSHFYVNKNITFSLFTLRKPVFRNYFLVNNINNTLNLLFILFRNKYTMGSHRVIIEIVTIVKVTYLVLKSRLL